jgi:exodeoxyribonuclease V gamma subunit
MALSVHRSERADALVSGLADVLAQPPADPFAADVVAVPSKGVERWIAQSLSATLGAAGGRQDGVCANVAFPSPARLVSDALSAAWGVAGDEDPWAEHRLAWPLLDVVDDCAEEDWCRMLGRHLGVGDGAVDRGRRMAVAQRLAGLYTSYGSQRPAMLRDWRQGRDTDGAGGELEADHRWQAELWRRLREEVGRPSPAERLEEACGRLSGDPVVVDLPGRLSVFGPTRLTTDQLRVLDALADHRDVHLWLPHPSAGLWRSVESAGVQVLPRRDDPSVELPRHPLLRSCARDAREMQIRMAAEWSEAARGRAGREGQGQRDEHLPGAGPPATLLGALQRDLHQDRSPEARHVLAADDTSVQVHACHGRQRQVEVLREVLLGLLADDETLQMRDIIVMCPDIEAYAPLISAAFGLSAGDDDGELVDAHPGHRLTVRLADRSLRQTNPVLEVAARLLDLADARVTVSEVLDLVELPPVRRRFRFDSDELDRVDDWVRRSGVRWGLDARARARFGLAGVAQNTWATGLDRVLVGVTMDEEDGGTFGSVLPLADVDSNEVDLAGRVAELLDRLAAAVSGLCRQQSLDAWVATLTTAVDGLVDVSPRDAWQLSQARRQLTDALASADQHASGTLLRLSDVRVLLGERLKGRPTRANFRTGHLTMCTMVPMRSVPHRVVCLLGVDDGVFPRGVRIDGDDILARRPLVGERDPRSEDRQLFLDAILAAEERLVLLYAGADERTGAERPPAVPLGELLDVLDATAQVADAPAGTRAPVRDRVLVRHPLQPFDDRNFVRGRLRAGGRPFSFDTASYAGSRALHAPRSPRPAFLPSPIPADGEPLDLVAMDSLVGFLEHPAKHFLRHRLGLNGVDAEAESDDGFPVEVGPLDQWQVGDRLLQAGLRGTTRERAVRAERLRGDLPPGPLGRSVVEPLAEHVRELVAKSSSVRAAGQAQVDVSVTTADGVTLAGTVPVFGDRVVRVVYSRLAAKHRIRAWVQLLALCAQRDDRPWEAVTIGRASRGLAASHLVGVPAGQALTHLGDLLAVYREGLAMPLPVPPKTACAYASRRAGDVPAGTSLLLAAQEWRRHGRRSVMGEGTDAEHQRIWGEVPLETLVGDPDPSDPAWPDEPHRFGQLARRVWTPLLAAERVDAL